MRACWVIKRLLGHSCEYQRWDQMSRDHTLLQASAVRDLWRRALARLCGIIPPALQRMRACCQMSLQKLFSPRTDMMIPDASLITRLNSDFCSCVPTSEPFDGNCRVALPADGLGCNRRNINKVKLECKLICIATERKHKERKKDVKMTLLFLHHQIDAYGPLLRHSPPVWKPVRYISWSGKG